MKPAVPKDTKLLNPPAGVDEEAYWQRVTEIHAQGLPWHNACKVARSELVGARETNGPLKRAGR